MSFNHYPLNCLACKMDLSNWLNWHIFLEIDEEDRLELRLRDFRFAQTRRRNTHGKSRPWGIIGLYEHLNAIRYDLEWAEDAAWRRENNEP